MLKSTSVSAIRVMAENLIGSRTAVMPRAGTPLALIVQQCYSPSLDVRERGCAAPVLTPDQCFGTVMDLVCRSNEPTVNDCRNHTDDSQDWVKVISTSVRGTVVLARNVVNPMIKLVVDEVEDRRKRLTATIANTMSVVTDNFESIWSSTVLDSLVERFKDAPAHGDVELFNIHPLLSEAQILELMKTGSQRFDEEIEDWVKSIGADYLGDVYRRFFMRDVSAETGKLMDSSEYGYHVHWFNSRGIAGRNDLLAVHLMSRSLLASPPEDVDMGLEEYRMLMAGVLEQTGRAICRLFESREFDRESKRLVLDWPMVNAPFNAEDPTRGYLMVNGDVYTEWLEAGGTPEILLGSAISDRNNGWTYLIENRNQYEKVWTNHVALVRTAQNSNEFNTVLSALRDAVTKLINEVPEEQLVNGTRAIMHDRLYDMLENTYISDTSPNHIYRTARKLVCATMFGNRDVRALLDNMDTISAEHPEVEIREIALLATIDLLTRWFNGLVDVVKGDAYNTHDAAVVTTVTLANMVQLIEDVIVEVAGDDIANQLNGEDIYSSAIADTVAANLQGKLVPRTLL